MALYFIGLGLALEHISIEAIRALRRCRRVYVDSYTSIVPGFSIKRLKEVIGSEVEVLEASRSDLEGRGIARVVDEASSTDVAILVPGDPFIATTHDAIRLEALRRGVEVRVVHGVSIYSAAASATGLQAYKFGKTVTLVYPRGFKPFSTIEAIRENLRRGLHTLVLLDLKLEENVAMSIREAAEIMIGLEEEYCREAGCSPVLADTIAVGCARVGTREQVLHADRLRRLGLYAYPPPPHCIVVTGRLHPIELELLKLLAGLPDEACRGPGGEGP